MFLKVEWESIIHEHYFNYRENKEKNSLFYFPNSFQPSLFQLWGWWCLKSFQHAHLSRAKNHKITQLQMRKSHKAIKVHPLHEHCLMAFRASINNNVRVFRTLSLPFVINLQSFHDGSARDESLIQATCYKKKSFLKKLTHWRAWKELNKKYCVCCAEWRVRQGCFLSGQKEKHIKMHSGTTWKESSANEKVWKRRRRNSTKKSIFVLFFSQLPPHRHSRVLQRKKSENKTFQVNIVKVHLRAPFARQKWMQMR